MYSQTLRPGTTLGSYPEKEQGRKGRLENAAHDLTGAVRRFTNRRAVQAEKFVDRVRNRSERLTGLNAKALEEHIATLRQTLAAERLNDDLAVHAFALVREVSRRTLRQPHYDTQIIGGWVLLHGLLAEMETGEGKTLTATLPACTAALAGIPVHVITANDYLAERDAELMAPIYRYFGLSVGTVTERVTDAEARRRAYACDVTYCTSKQVAFDYLRDRISIGPRRGRLDLQLRHLQAGQRKTQAPLLRGLCYAIVDEADSVLIDEARTPLILSRTQKEAPDPELFVNALALAEGLEADREFRIDMRHREVRLTPSGKAKIDRDAENLGGPWRNKRVRHQLVVQALSARHLYLRDRDYLVADGKAQIIDPNTGRVLPDHSWEQGLHQMVEVKEGGLVTSEKQTLARMSYQRFFRRYLHLSGMTGTAKEVSSELWSVYGLQVVTIPTHRPVLRKGYRDQVHRTANRKWQAVMKRIRELHKQGRPILVGTRSVTASEQLGALLSGTGLPHRVLNARQDRQESEIISRAGEQGAITIATNMAGRGTDIRLGGGVAELGGLHVLATEHNEARRIDRQLFGRCGRQGDPGCYEVFASLEDDLLKENLPGPLTNLLIQLAQWRIPLPGRFLVRFAQRTAERHHARLRRNLLQADERTRETMAFTGPIE